MALVLLVGAGLMIRSLAALWRVNPGFKPSHAITFSLSLPASPTTTVAETRARLREFDDKMMSIPGVEAVSATLGSRPMQHDSSESFWIEGQPKPAELNDMNPALFYLAEAGFQKAMGITLERGRFITPQDDEHSPIVIVVDDVFAHKFFPGENPDRQAHQSGDLQRAGGNRWRRGARETVGPRRGRRNRPLRHSFTIPSCSFPTKFMPLAATGVAVVLRTKGDPAQVMGPVRRAVAQLDPREVIYNVSTMQEVVTSSFAARRFSMILLGIFAGWRWCLRASESMA